MKTPRLLLCAAEGSPLAGVQRVLRSMDYEVLRCDPSACEAALSEFGPDGSLLDLSPAGDPQLFARVRNLAPSQPVLCAVPPELPLQRPDPLTLFLPQARIADEFLVAFSRLLDCLGHAEELQDALLRHQGRSESSRLLRQRLERAALATAPVLLQGEIGTGKELAARTIGSLRSPYIVVHCSAIPEHLFESELFGHLRGALPQATSDHKGAFEQAHGGTLFLNEICELPLVHQAKLVRVLQEGEIRPLGSNRSKRVEVRVIAASSRNLAEEVTAGSFRQDLLLILDVIALSLRPLRERPEDIEALASFFLSRYAQGPGNPPQLEAGALQLLCELPWPGNTRELENLLHRAAVAAEGGVVRKTLLRELLAEGPQAQALPNPWQEFNYDGFTRWRREQERLFLAWHLAQERGSVSRTAERLGMQRTALHSRIRALTLDLDNLRGRPRLRHFERNEEKSNAVG
jgi:DNA-binding NtrC family response regulator